MPASSTKSPSMSQRFFLAPEFDSLITSLARQPSSAIRLRSRASELRTCATRCATPSPTVSYGPQVGASTPTAFVNGVLPAAVSAAFNALKSAPLSARHAVIDFTRSLHVDL